MMTAIKGRASAFLLVAAVLVLSAAASSSEATELYKPKKVREAPTIDGRLDDDCWKGPQKIGRFVKVPFGPAPQPADARSVARLCYDDGNLYVAVECLEPAIQEINKRFTRRDDAIWGDDCVEIFIAPDYTDLTRYSHFAVNTLGTQTDQKARGMQGFDMAWNGAWKAAARILKDRWVVEVQIPFADIDVKDVKSINLMGVAVCRERKAGKGENTVWEIGGSFHRPEGLVVFTSLERFIENDLLPLWQSEKAVVLELLKAPDALRPDQREALKGIVKTADEEIARARKAASADTIKAMSRSIQTAVRKAGALKRDARFNLFIARLRKAVARKPSGK